MGEHLVKHGDGVKDIAFTVQDCDFLVQVSTTAVNAEVFSQIHRFMFSLTHSPHVLSCCTESPGARRRDREGALHPGGQARASAAGRAADGERAHRLCLLNLSHEGRESRMGPLFLSVSVRRHHTHVGGADRLQRPVPAGLQPPAVHRPPAQHSVSSERN